MPLTFWKDVLSFLNLRGSTVLTFAVMSMVAWLRWPLLASFGLSNWGHLGLIRSSYRQDAPLTIESSNRKPPDSALPIFEMALAIYSPNSRARVRLGDLKWSGGDREAAIASWKIATVQNPFDSITWVRLGIAYDEQDLNDEALEAWRRAGPQMVSSLLVMQGIGMRKSDDVEEALTYFRDAVTLMPSSALANYLLAETYLQLGMLEQSADVWSKSATLYPENDWQHWWAIGEASRIRLQWDIAAEAYASGVPLSPRPEEFYRRLGQVHESDDHPEAALAAYREAVSVAPDQIDAYLAMGALEWKLGNLDSARVWYELTAAKFPNSALAFQWLGVIAHQEGELAESIRWLRLAHEKNPQSAEALSYLADSYYASGEVVLAIESLEQAVWLASHSAPQVWYQRLQLWRSEFLSRSHEN